MLRLTNISKRFDGQAALDGVHLDVDAGETVALIGPSGCGKSTLLRLIIGLVAPDAGQIQLDEGTLADARGEQLRRWRRQIGYVIQEGGLFPHLSGRDNVCLQARHQGWEEEPLAERVDELRRLVHLPAECFTRFPSQLSGGQRQRLSLMRALVLDPRVLLLDEPLGALDPMIRADLQRDLRTIFRNLGKTVLLVTHDLAEARYLADRLVLFSAGRIVQVGRYKDLVEQPTDPFVTRFLDAQKPMHERVLEESS